MYSEHKWHRIQCDRPLNLHCNQKATCSINHLLQLLHGQGAHSLGSWLGLEHAWLLGEGVDSLASCASCLLLQLGSSQLHVVGHDGLHVLHLEAGLLSNSTE